MLAPIRDRVHVARHFLHAIILFLDFIPFVALLARISS
jgi:hypothetical protein